MVLQVHLSTPSERTIGKAAEIIRSGGILIYPTDTIYGMGCSVENRNAIERIHLIKRQRQDHPFSFVCSDLTHISEYAHVNNNAFRVMKRLIPGPYTFILPAARMKHLPRILISKRKTVGIRVPLSPVALALVRAVGNPILSTSVTTTGGETLNTPDRIVDEFHNQVDMILDGGPLISEPSTVLDLTGDIPQVIRAGAGNPSGIL